MAKKILVEGKSLLSSRTFWFNVLFVLVSIASVFGFKDFAPNEKTLELLGAVGAIVNIVLRVVSKEQITKLK